MFTHLNIVRNFLTHFKYNNKSITNKYVKIQIQKIQNNLLLNIYVNIILE